MLVSVVVKVADTLTENVALGVDETVAVFVEVCVSVLLPVLLIELVPLCEVVTSAVPDGVGVRLAVCVADPDRVEVRLALLLRDAVTDWVDVTVADFVAEPVSCQGVRVAKAVRLLVAVKDVVILLVEDCVLTAVPEFVSVPLADAVAVTVTVEDDELSPVTEDVDEEVLLEVNEGLPEAELLGVPVAELLLVPVELPELDSLALEVPLSVALEVAEAVTVADCLALPEAVGEVVAVSDEAAELEIEDVGALLTVPEIDDVELMDPVPVGLPDEVDVLRALWELVDDSERRVPVAVLEVVRDLDVVCE